VIRARRLALLLAIPLALPAAAGAADTEVTVGDDFFEPQTARIEPGDTVTWRWNGSADHTVKSDEGQAESFASPILNGTGKTFVRTFDRAGRFTYFCEIHPENMRGVVEVGSPPFPDSTLPRLTRLKAKPGDGRVRLSFRVSELSRVKVTLAGPSDRSTTKRLGKGKRSVAFRRLRAGRYKATLRPTDSSGNRGKAVVERFRVG
jgi:plastocyanin